jgi:hypothetical protein
MKSPLMRTFINFKNTFFPPETIPEVAIAYNHRLPQQVKVSWFRDGEFIIGKIEADGSQFMTQAKSAKEFVEMVNDTIYAAYGMPAQYSHLLKKLEPKPEEFKKLNDVAIASSVIGFVPKIA